MNHSRLLCSFGCGAVTLVSLMPLVAGQANPARSSNAGVQMRASRQELVLHLTLPHRVENPAHAVANIKLLSPEDAVRAESTHEIDLVPGQTECVFRVARPFDKVPKSELDELRWLRVRYELRTVDGRVFASSTEALRSEATDPFILTAAASTVAIPGRWYQVRVHTRSVDNKPLRALRVQGTLTWDSDQGEQKLMATAITNARGDGTIAFLTPADMPAARGELKLVAVRGLAARSVEQEVYFGRSGYVLLDTDKEIYQPGQTLHARILRFSAKRKAVENETLEVRIIDEERTLVSKQTVTTNTFGVAHLDWQIPGNMMQGQYQIQARRATGDEDDRHTEAVEWVHIYRYDLPSFAVTAQPDRPYYLPAQNAEVKVSAQYMFGKPLTRGKVRVVQEEERTWNFRKQEWEVKEQQAQTGELDHDGQFTARFDLSKSHADLEDSTYTQYHDVGLAAYVTDPTTGHTEQRRVLIRVTRDPIHVYIAIKGGIGGKLPVSYYISTFYADGTPARCKLQLSSFDESDKTQVKHPLGSAVTNRYGLALVADLAAPKDEDQDSLLVEATDAKGLTGHADERIPREDLNYLYVTTSHTIHKPGDPIEVTVRGTQSSQHVTVEVLHDGAIMATQHATLHSGRAYLVFPYDARFSDEVTVVAYSLEGEESPRSYLRNARSVLYPKNRQLSVELALDKSEHRPGQKANVRFTVQSADKSLVESALGVKIVARAVEERARTDSDFGQGSRWGSWRWSLWSAEADNGFGGISRDDLDRIDLSRPVPQDLDLVAERILRWGYSEVPELLYDQPGRPADEAFSKLVERQFETLEGGLKEQNEQGKQPRNDVELAQLGKEYGVDVPNLLDPWGTPYKYELHFAGSNHVLTVISAGPDRHFGTSDDFTARQTERPFFYYARLFHRAFQEALEKEGRVIRDRQTLSAEMMKQGVDIESLRDPWNQPYEIRFSISGSFYVAQIVSHGQKTSPQHDARGTLLWENKVDYFSEAREHMDQAINAHLRAGGSYPENEQQFRAIMASKGVNLDELRDPWGSPYFIVFRNAPEYSDRVTIRQSATSGERASEPVTLVRKEVLLMSPGKDKRPGTDDDFSVAGYWILVAEQGAKDRIPEPPRAQLNLTANTGAITGTVTDPTGAVIINATVQATLEGTAGHYSTQTDNQGNFEFKDLKPGSYQLEASARGFQTLKVGGVPVHSMQLVNANLTLAVGSITETVEVAAGPVAVETTQTLHMSMSLPAVTQSLAVRAPAARPLGVMGTANPSAMSTPRLRQDFPETMLWEPALVTDRQGRTRLNFKMADNITTWKLTAVASTKNGELGRAEKDLRAFQPFFVEHDPPRILTLGDEIAYPVVLRNYLDQAQTLKAWIKPESWFTLLGPQQASVKVEAGDAASAIFGYRAVAAVTDGKQQVGAANADISDAAQKSVDVHPFGRPASVTVGGIFEKDETFLLPAPADAIAGSLKARVKIYPNLLAHVVENMEAGLERPNGCGEQTISSTYPSLLVTEIYAKSATKPAVALKAKRYLEAGYEQLLRYQDSSGGFTYWGHGAPDLALTAYAVEFLDHASHFTEVGAPVVQAATNWILTQQGPDGSWRNHGNNSDKDAVLLTAYLAQTLAVLADQEDQKAQDPQQPNLRKTALAKALAFLATHRDLLDEPYAVASYALAARAVGNAATSAELLARLQKDVHYEDNAAYWALEQNTPFYGWGRAGRLESTALALQALADSGSADLKDKQLIRQGLLFLLRNEDKDGMWYSGQTTVHVLKTLLSAVAMKDRDAGGRLQVRVNNHDVATLDLPPGQTVAPPIEVDVTKFIKPGGNRVELATATAGAMSAHIVAESYVPWKDEDDANKKSNATSKLKFTVSYSTTEAAPDDPIECRVRAERLGYRGYGMMLGEIGLPPGADVDRQSLEHAVKGSYALDRYDVLQDRVIVYLWPQAGGSEFTFRFRPRFAMQAETAPSTLYDYYNPDSAVTLKPVRFDVAAGNR